MLKVGEVEEVLGFVRDDHHALADRVFTVGGAYKDLKLDSKHEISMGTRLAIKIHKRGEVAVITGRHVFVPKVGTEDRIMEFFKRFAGGRINSSSSR